MTADVLASVALDGSLPCNYSIREVKPMKIKTTFYSRKKGVDFDPVIKVVYPKSRADQLSYQPTSKLVDAMVRTGQLVLASKNLYDFPDGKDDGRDVPVDRVRGLDYPEISMAMAENEKKVEAHRRNIKAMAEKEKDDKAASDSAPEKQADDTSGA